MALPSIHSRVYDPTELKDLYDGTYSSSVDDAHEIDQTADKTATTTAQNSSVDTYIAALKAGWPYADFATFEAAVDSGGATLKTDLETDLDANIDDVIAVQKDDILDLVRTDYDTIVQDEGYTNACPKCQTTGLQPIYDVDGTATGETENCDVCDGFGFTDGADAAYYLDGNSRRFRNE